MRGRIGDYYGFFRSLTSGGGGTFKRKQVTIGYNASITLDFVPEYVLVVLNTAAVAASNSGNGNCEYINGVWSYMTNGTPHFDSISLSGNILNITANNVTANFTYLILYSKDTPT